MTKTHRIGAIAGVLVLAAFAGCGSPPPVLLTDAGPMDSGPIPMDADIRVDAGHDAAVPPPVDAGPMCMGMVTACNATSGASECGGIQGCGYGQCAGVAPDCHHLVTMATCDAIPGCMWNGICRGIASPCASHADMTSCTAQAGCTWGTTPSCSGAAAPCGSFTFSDCNTQPGCVLGMPDAFVAPPDAFVVPPDANCMTGGTSTMVMVHTIEPNLTAGGTRDLGSVHVHAESACGGADMQLVTDAGGALTLNLPDGGAPWTITFAKAGYAAVSIVDITHIGFAGDVRLDPLVIGGTTTNFGAMGTITGPGAASAIFQVDTYDFDTIRTTAGARTFASPFTVGLETPAPPLQFVALELDAGGHAVNIGSTTAIARPSAPVTGVSIAMSSPAQAPVTTHIRLHLPTVGLTSPPSATTIDPEHALFATPNAPFVITGTSVLAPIGGDPANLDLAVTHFTGPLDVNITSVRVVGAVALVNIVITDIRDQDITVPPVTNLASHGATLGSLTASADGTGYDVLILHIGESGTQAPHWRVFADARSGTASIGSVPHLPTAVTLADIGLGATTTYIPLYVHMQTGQHAWTTQAFNRAVPEYAWAAATQYFTVSTAGR